MRRLLVALATLTLVFAATPAVAEDELPPAVGPDLVIFGGTGVISAAVEEHLTSCTTGTVSRIAGRDRYETAAAISQAAFTTATTVFLAVGTNYPDAVAAGPAAKASGSPILLVKSDSVPSVTRIEIERLGATNIVLLGGEAAISESVADTLASSFTVTRLSGLNRYETAAEISAAAFPDPVPVVYIATGENFPDALAGGPAAVAAGGPILLTLPTAIPDATTEELLRLAPEHIVVLGGSSVVGDEVVGDLEPYASGTVTRVARDNRYATAAAVAETLPAAAGPIYLGTGWDFPDILAGTPLAGTSPVLLASRHELPSATAVALSAMTGSDCEPFEEIIKVMVSSFTTYYSAGQSRVTNIHTIADAVNGATVQPGDVFSINGTVGQRTVARGYVAAPAIINGELYCCDSPVNIGGGTSQFATTLYNAAFFGAYEDVYHKPHSIYFSKYPMGREATLGWTGPDVKFRNDTDYPVEIRASYTSTSVTVELWGWNEGRTVTTARSGNATTADGGVVTVSRTITYADGSTKRETWTHRYNPLEPDEPTPAPDPTPTPTPPPSGGGGGGGQNPV